MSLDLLKKELFFVGKIEADASFGKSGTLTSVIVGVDRLAMCAELRSQAEQWHASPITTPALGTQFETSLGYPLRLQLRKIETALFSFPVQYALVYKRIEPGAFQLKDCDARLGLGLFRRFAPRAYFTSNARSRMSSVSLHRVDLARGPFKLTLNMVCDANPPQSGRAYQDFSVLHGAGRQSGIL